MSNEFTLDSLRAELEREFAPVKFPLRDGKPVVLQNLLRVPEAAREAVIGALTELEEADAKREDTEKDDPANLAKLAGSVYSVLRNVAADGRGEALVKELNGDVLLGIKLIEKWSAVTQPGEAQDSPA
jgi:hypothetical protein